MRKPEKLRIKDIRMINLLLFIIVILLALWLLGIVIHIAGGFIHLLLIIVLVLAIIWLAQRII